MIFSRKRSVLPPLSLKIDGTFIFPAPYTTFLGLTFDSKLMWRKHIEQKCIRVKTLINNVRRLFRLTWGLDTLKLKLFYTAVFLPTLLYGCSVWARAATMKGCQTKLKSVQRLMLLCVTRAFKSVSLNALLVIANVLPIELVVIEQTVKRFMYFSANQLEFSMFSQKSIQSYTTQILHCPSSISYSKRFFSIHHPPWKCISSPQVHYLSAKRNIPVFPEHPLRANVFTDGSKADGKAGIGILIFFSDGTTSSYKEKLPDHATVFQAECLAISLAIKHLTSTKADISDANVYTDSQAAITAIITTGKVCSITSYARSLILDAHFRVTLNWIPSHSGEEGNEMADRLAKEAAKQTTSATVSVGLHPSIISTALNTCLNERWKEEWSGSSTGKTTKEFFPSPQDASILKNKFHHLTQITTGHCMLNEYLHRIGQRTTALCDCGNDTETIQHFLFDCPRYEIQRKNLRTECTHASLPFPPPMSAFCKSPTLWLSLVSFYQSTKRLSFPRSQKTS